MGGDPSIDTTVSFNGEDMKKEQAYKNPMAMNTGYTNPD